MTTLDQAVEDILDAIADGLEAAMGETGGGLSEVQAVVRGDRSSPVPELPALFVVPDAAQYEQTDFGDAETWVMDVAIAALVWGEDPTHAAQTSRRLAARARQVAIEIRHEVEGLTDITSRTFDPAVRRSETNKALFWTDATVRARFVVDE